MTAPINAEQGTSFIIQVNQTARNNGPLSPINAVESVTFLHGSDCTVNPDDINDLGNIVAGQSRALNGMVMGDVVTVQQITFNVTCTQPGLHQFTFTNSISSSTGVFDPNLANNSKQDFVSVVLN